MCQRTCSIDGCGEISTARGMCSSHYGSFCYHGDPLKATQRKVKTLPRRATFTERFWSKVAKGPGCWEWMGAKARGGYGHMICCDNGSRRNVQSHRVAYELYYNTKIPAGLTIDHLCRNPGCVRPDHLQAVTQRENNMRSNSPLTLNAKKTHCVRGHALSGTNVRIRPGKYGPRRNCRQCDLDYRKRKAGLL